MKIHPEQLARRCLFSLVAVGGGLLLLLTVWGVLLAPIFRRAIISLGGSAGCACDAYFSLFLNPWAVGPLIATGVVVGAVLLWGVAKGVMLLVVNIRFSQQLRQQSTPIPQTIAQQLPRSLKGRKVLLLPRGDGLFCTGLLRPRVYVSQALISSLAREELAAALAHEAYHLMRRAPLQLFLAIWIEQTFFFLPPAKKLLDDYRLLEELAADAHAQMASGPSVLRSALEKTLTLRSQFPQMHPANAVFFFHPAEARIVYLLEGKLRSRGKPISLFLSATVLVGVLFAAAVPFVGAVARGPLASQSTLGQCIKEEPQMCGEDPRNMTPLSEQSCESGGGQCHRL